MLKNKDDNVIIQAGVKIVGRLNVSHEEFPGLGFEFEHFFGRDEKIHTRKIVSSAAVPHIHDFPQFYYCASGTCRQIEGGREYILRPGDMIFIRQGEVHNFFFDDLNGHIINFNISFEFLQKYYNKLSATAVAFLFLGNFSEELDFTLPVTVSLGENSRKVAEKALLELEENDNKKEYDIENVINLINRVFSISEFQLPKAVMKKTDDVISGRLLPVLRAVSYMNKNFSKKVHCEDLLKVSGLCRTDFYKTIKKTVGETYSIYLQKIRVKRAHRALGFSEYSFSYISDMCGFGSATYFGKCYKKYRGYTPKEERAALHELLERYPGIRVSHEFFEADYIDNKRNGTK